MPPRMFGVESEYALVGQSPNGRTVGYDRLLGELVRLMQERPHLPGYPHGDFFLTNGARFYIDSGGHPEFTTPESTNPWDVVRYIRAGERILSEACDRIPSSLPSLTEVSAYKCNVDYIGSGSTWGCHESYLHRADPQAMPKQLVPHLVSRVIYAGAGGFDARSNGLEFTLSPRACHIMKTVSSESTANRGIFHTKDEPLCQGGYHRLHLLCGESLCSEISTWLKIGATALVVAMAEAGLAPGEAVDLKAPLDALRTFAADPECKVEVTLADQRRLGAIAIQRHYLAAAEAHSGDAFMPPWAGEVCRRWREILDRLEAAPRSLAQAIDWAIKLELYRDHARRRGIAWESLPSWTHVLNRLLADLKQTEYADQPVKVEFLLGPESPIRDGVERLTPYLKKKSLTWEGLRPFVDLRSELFEIDFKFGRLGDGGIFAALDRQGVLTHHVDGVDDIEHATSHPPREGRARIRGEVIRRLAGKSRARCDWQRIWDGGEKQSLDLTDPYATEERWEKVNVGERPTLAALLDDLF